MATANAAFARAQEAFPRSKATSDGARFALQTVAALAGTASLYTGTTYGFDRAGMLGVAVGAACAIGCLLGPRLLLQAIKMRDAGRAIAAALMIAIAAPVAISAALGAAATARETAARAETKATGDQQRAQAAYERATAALARLPVTRPVAALEAALSAALKDTRLHDCRGWLASARLRAVCIRDVEPLRLELANAQERARLAASQDAAALLLRQQQHVKPAGLDAAAIARLAGRLGMMATADQVSDALLVLLVMATELLGGAALALAAPISGTRAVSKTDLPAAGDSESAKPCQEPEVVVPSVESEASDTIIERLSRGPLIGRQRDLAATFNLPITTFRRRVEGMPNVRLTATPTGSRLELVSAMRH
jgi:hypothetical protein